MTTPTPRTEADCWFCDRTVAYEDLIAGYDTWDEQRLACSDCDRCMKALHDKGYRIDAAPAVESLTVERLLRLAVANIPQSVWGQLDESLRADFLAALATPEGTEPKP